MQPIEKLELKKIYKKSIVFFQKKRYFYFVIFNICLNLFFFSKIKNNAILFNLVNWYSTFYI